MIASRFIQSKSDHSLFTRGPGASFVVLLVYFDDIIIATPNFKMKDLGPLKYFIGLEIAHSNTGIDVCHRQYALLILDDFGFLQSKPKSTPMNIRTVTSFVMPLLTND